MSIFIRLRAKWDAARKRIQVKLFYLLTPFTNFVIAFEKYGKYFFIDRRRNCAHAAYRIRS